MTVAAAISSIASKSCNALPFGNREEEFEARTVDSTDVVSLVMEVLRVAVSVTVDPVMCTFVNVMLATFVVEDFGFEEFVAGT